jgi:AAA domain/DnaB-like helicase N terminal domain
LQPGDFYRPSHGRFYEAALALDKREEPTDALILIAEINADEEQEAQLHELALMLPPTANVAHHARLVVKAAERRERAAAAIALHAETMNGGDPSPELRERVVQALAPRRASGDGFQIEVYTAKDLTRLPLPQEDPELVGPFLRRGRITLLGATTGHGKTTFGVQMLAVAVLGGDFLGWDVQGGLRVLVLDLEQHLEDIQEQLAAVGLADSELIDYAPIPEGLEIDRDPAQLAELERVVSAKPYDIVRVDPFYKLHAADSSEEQQARELVRHTRGWVNRHGFGLLMDTHTRKRIEGKARFVLDDLFGSSLFARDPETILGLQFIEDGFSRLRIFKARGRRGGIRTGQTIDLLYNDEELFRRKPEEAERDFRAELIALGSDHAWRTLKEWKAKAGDPEPDPEAENYVELRGGIGAGETPTREALNELLTEGTFEYAEGADAGRHTGSKCWRLTPAPDAQGTPGHPGVNAGVKGSDDAPASLLPLPKGAVGAEGSSPSGASEGASGVEGRSVIGEDEIERLAELSRMAQNDYDEPAKGGRKGET